jgi:translation initiation factor IF-3
MRYARACNGARRKTISVGKENTAITKALRMNEQIRITPIRVINHNQDQLGVIPTHEALSMARELGLDLVEVSPMERPPVCRIMDYGKFKYERKKRQKVAAASHVIQIKEIRLRPKTDSHDREIKVKHAREFLTEGHKVQFTMLFKGRERVHKEIANEIFGEIVTQLGETAKLERAPMMDGKRMTMVVCPAKH